MRSGFLIVSTAEAALLDHSLAAAVSEGFDEALVVDNASTDATAWVAERHGVPRLALPHRVPYTEAMNAGLQRMKADAIALLQADTFVAPGYRAASLGALADPQIGSVAPKLLRCTGPRPEDRLPLIDAAGMAFDRRRKNSLVGHGRPAAEYTTAAEVFGADGAAAVYRRETLEDCAIDGEVFDQNMPGWGCDADLAWRARMLGWRSRYEPAAVVYHIRTYSPTTRARTRPVDRRTQFRNRLLMIAKNDAPADLRRDAGPLALYEVLALGYALLREPELLRGYRDAARRLPGARRRRRLVQARRRTGHVPFGLKAPQ
ncbi:MAG TPA: glycosyltransferase [Solirubrobacteraceae bacterium]|nr:glycosyltransferase [Solirubrobacteraceae bacterium]